MAKDELLSIRLQEMKEDVALVVRMLTRSKSRGEPLNSIGSLVKVAGDGTIGESVFETTKQINTLARTLSNEADDITALMTDIQANLTELDARLKKAAQAATVIGQRMQELDRIVDAETQSIEDSLQDCNELIDKIDGVIGDLNEGADQEAAWDAFDDLMAECEPLFADYVDFLSGVTLRDYQLDNGVAALAELVFKELRAEGIAMPARQGHLPTKMRSLAKFQFPEWTLWDVPLAGYHAGLCRSERIAGAIIDQSLDAHPETFPSALFAEKLFADIYASCMVGPAYGYAALLLHVHPRKTTRTKDCPSAADRAHVILAALAHSGKTAPDFAGHIDLLAQWWDVAAEGGRAAPARDADALDIFVTQVMARLENRTSPPPYDPARWKEVITGLETTDDVRAQVLPLDRLNAAWHLRITNPAIVAELSAEDLIPTPKGSKTMSGSNTAATGRFPKAGSR
ncbi:hypothetical protein [Mycolicibacterium wolinskyi]|uniref:hypothetical protein n=1 Tax=Mycolicibacterium wolinskyi TaxID=59750 RepID=UPI003917748F